MNLCLISRAHQSVLHCSGNAPTFNYLLKKISKAFWKISGYSVRMYEVKLGYSSGDCLPSNTQKGLAP